MSNGYLAQENLQRWKDKRVELSIFLSSGIKLNGIIHNHDETSVYLESHQLVFLKHVATIQPKV